MSLLLPRYVQGAGRPWFQLAGALLFLAGYYMYVYYWPTAHKHFRGSEIKEMILYLYGILFSFNKQND